MRFFSVIKSGPWKHMLLTCFKENMFHFCLQWTKFNCLKYLPPSLSFLLVSINSFILFTRWSHHAFLCPPVLPTLCLFSSFPSPILPRKGELLTEYPKWIQDHQYLPPSKRTFQTVLAGKVQSQVRKAGWLNKCKNIVLAVKMIKPANCQNNISCSQRNNHNKNNSSWKKFPYPITHWIPRKTTNCPDLVSRILHDVNSCDVNSCDVNSWPISSKCTITLLTKS